MNNQAIKDSLMLIYNMISKFCVFKKQAYYNPIRAVYFCKNYLLIHIHMWFDKERGHGKSAKWIVSRKPGEVIKN